MSAIQQVLDLDAESRTRGYAARGIADEYSRMFNSTSFHNALVELMTSAGVSLAEADGLAGSVHHAVGELTTLHGQVATQQANLISLLEHVRDARRSAIDARMSGFQIN